MSFSKTTDQVRAQTKDVTRRLGWRVLKANQYFLAVEKGMGLKKGEKVKVLTAMQCVSNRRERLDAITQDDVRREGFPEMSRQDFIDFFCAFNGVKPSKIVQRIEFKYVNLTPPLCCPHCMPTTITIMNKEQAEKYAAFLRFVISQFTSFPDKLKVEIASSMDVSFAIRCAKSDEALIIGREGRNIKGLSELMNCYVALDGKRSARLHVMTEKAESATIFQSRKKTSWNNDDTESLLDIISKIHEYLFPFTVFTVRAEQDKFETCRSVIFIETRDPINAILMTAYDQIFRAIGKFRGRTISVNNTTTTR